MILRIPLQLRLSQTCGNLTWQGSCWPVTGDVQFAQLTSPALDVQVQKQTSRQALVVQLPEPPVSQHRVEGQLVARAPVGDGHEVDHGVRKRERLLVGLHNHKARVGRRARTHRRSQLAADVD